MSAVLDTKTGPQPETDDLPRQFNPEFVEATRKLEAEWRAKFDAIAQKFGVDPAAYSLKTDSGLPLKPVYFPHDVADQSYGMLSAPGTFPFTRDRAPA